MDVRAVALESDSERRACGPLTWDPLRCAVCTQACCSGTKSEIWGVRAALRPHHDDNGNGLIAQGLEQADAMKDNMKALEQASVEQFCQEVVLGSVINNELALGAESEDVASVLPSLGLHRGRTPSECTYASKAFACGGTRG